MKFSKIIKNKAFRESVFPNLIEHHLKNEIAISNSPLRLGSSSFNEYVYVVRRLHEEGLYTPINSEDMFILEKLDTGKVGFYKGEKVILDTPFLLKNERKEFGVYRANKEGKKDKGGNIKAVVVKWGDPKLRVKNEDKDASESFWARHRCDLKTDKYKAGWWACYAPQYFGDLLKLVGGKSKW